MSVAAVVTRGFGSFGSVNKLPTLGYGIGAAATPYSFTMQVGRVYVPGMSAGRVFTPGPTVSTTHAPGFQRAKVIK